MADSPLSLDERIEKYAEKYSLSVQARLGYGNDGSVWLTKTKTAVKIFYREETFDRERRCYVRLLERNVRDLAGFAVPVLINYEYYLQAIEMSFVVPPCVLDFGKTRLDHPADYSPEVLADAEAMERELFEPDQWKQVRRIRAALQGFGIYYYDARPSNIIFPER